MGVGHGRPRPKVAEMTLRIYGHAIHPEWFETRARERIAHSNWQAEIRILTCGHVVFWIAGRSIVTEVLTGPDVDLPEIGLLYRSPLKSERTARVRPRPESEYQVSFEVERLAPDLFGHLTDEYTLDAHRGALFHRFEPPSRLERAPLSSILHDARPKGISTQVIHTFPDENAVVRVQSLFETVLALP